MKTMSSFTVLLVVAVVFASVARAAVDAGTSPDFNEVRSVLQEHLVGSTEAQLNQAAVQGLLGELKGRAVLLANAGESVTNSTVLVTSESLVDSGIGYVRVKRIATGLDAAVAAAVMRLTASNKLVGLVLDLRYAAGTDYGAAAATVDLFLSDEVPLLNAGKGLLRSKKKDDAIKLPVVALVNHETSAAAEALAAMLRQAGVGLLIGHTTAGRAGLTADYPLSNGQTLRVLTAFIQLGDAKPVPPEGVVPDVAVTVKPEDEALYYEDPYTRLNGSNGDHSAMTSTNGVDSAKRVRVTEADLVREKRGDGDIEALASARAKVEERPPKVTDPALERAIDLLKGLAVVRQWKS
jgi:carboxyl-terminal processing protease